MYMPVENSNKKITAISQCKNHKYCATVLFFPFLGLFPAIVTRFSPLLGIGKKVGATEKLDLFYYRFFSEKKLRAIDRSHLYPPR